MRDADFATSDERLSAVLFVELLILLSVAVFVASSAPSAAKLSPLERWQASIRLMLGRPLRA
jgi:hypothetical protein